MAHWLSWRIGVGLNAAREQVRVARALRGLPLVAAALERGELSYAKVRAMTRVATEENEAKLLMFAQSSTGAQLERICRSFRQVTRGRGARDDDERWVRRRHLPSGMVRIEAQPLPDEAERVMAALGEARRAAASETASSATAPRDVTAVTSHGSSVTSHGSSLTPAGDVTAVTPSPRDAGDATLADGLLLVAESFMAHGPRARSGGARTQLFVHLHEERLADVGGDFRAVLPDGTSLSGATLLRLACDAGLVVAKVDDQGVLDVGRRRRSIPPAIARALWIRDGGCRFPGCGARVHCSAHHIEHWSLGGPTALRNLCLLCHHHHVLVHEKGFRIERAVDGSLVFLTPDGVPIENARRPPKLGGRALSQLNRADIEPHTNLPRWDGAGLSRDTLGWCVSALLPPAYH
jgi:hypothetical protein